MLFRSLVKWQDEFWQHMVKQYPDGVYFDKTQKLQRTPQTVPDTSNAEEYPFETIPSTQMCMRELERAIQGGEQVLDLGSGSGILSITAVLLGAAHATGVDIDPKAEDIARENAAINQIFSDRFTAVTGDVIGDRAMMESLKGHYDVVLANIVADVIIPLSRVVPEFLQEDSIFICSGILNTRLDEVLAALEKNGLQILSSEQQEDWCRVTAALLEA